MGKRIKSEKKGGGESKFIEEYTPLHFSQLILVRSKIVYNIPLEISIYKNPSTS
jgi:hypothetical protein